MSYLSGRHMSRDDYYQSASYVSDSERGVKGEEVEGDALLAGDHGGRGTGLAGGYPGSPFSRQPPIGARAHTTPALSVYAPVFAPELAGAGDDCYAGYDPGMAGCTTEQGTCLIPGMPWMGPSPPSRAAHPHSHTYARMDVPVTSRGYERDEDEYAASVASSAGDKDDNIEYGPAQARAPVVAVAAAEPNPNQDPLTTMNTIPARAADSNSNPEPESEPERSQGHTPSLGTRLVGRVERLAGKVLRDPDIQARGKRHMTGHL